MITNVVNIFELNIDVFACLKEISRSYNCKCLVFYYYKGYNPDLMTVTDILISGIPSRYKLVNLTRIVAARVSIYPCRSVCEK